MQLKNRFRPFLEHLESRETPSATTRFSAGVLSVTVDNSSTAVVFTQTANNSIDTAIGTTVAGAVVVNHAANVSSIQVTTGNGVDTVELNLNSFKLGATVQVTMGSGGGDVFSISGGATDAADGTGALGGRLTVSLGNAATNSITINHGAAVNGQASFTGSSAGNTSFTLGNGASATSTGTLGANDTLSRIATVTMFSTGLGTANGLTISDSSLGVDTTLELDGTILGNLSFSGSSGLNTGHLVGKFLGTTTINDAAGQGSVTTHSATLDGSFAQAFSYTGGNTSDSFTTSSAAVFDGNVTLNFGNGANTYTMPSFTIHGNLSITGGNGGNDLASNFVTAASTLDGNLTIVFGNGANAWAIGNNLLTFHGNQLSYTGGTGNDTVTVTNLVAGSSVPNLIIKVGGSAGTDTVNLSGITTANEFGLIDVTFGTFGTKVWTGGGPAAGSYSSFGLHNFP